MCISAKRSLTLCNFNYFHERNPEVPISRKHVSLDPNVKSFIPTDVAVDPNVKSFIPTDVSLDPNVKSFIPTDVAVDPKC